MKPSIRRAPRPRGLLRLLPLVLATALGACDKQPTAPRSNATAIRVVGGDLTLLPGKTVQIVVADTSASAIAGARVLVSVFGAANAPVLGEKATFATSNGRVANVDRTGMIQALSPGHATITVRVGAVSAAIDVAVERPYQVTYLGQPGDGQSIAYDINEAGDVVGGFLDAYTSGFRWHAGTRTLLNVKPLSINDAGAVAGLAQVQYPHSAVTFRPVILHGASIDTVNPEPSDVPQYVVAGLNASGTLAFTVYSGTGHNTGERSYRYEAGVSTRLTGASGNLDAKGINARGVVVGNTTYMGYDQRAFMQVDGRVTILTPEIESGASAVNDQGRVAGYTRASLAVHSRAVTWQEGGATPTYLPVFKNGDVDSEALALNNTGIVVGYEETQPMRWKDGHPAHLNDLIVDPEWTFIRAFAVNDAGQIVGYGLSRTTGQRGALLLTPAP